MACLWCGGTRPVCMLQGVTPVIVGRDMGGSLCSCFRYYQTDTATHTCLHNVLREAQMQRDAVALPAQQLSVTPSHFLLSALLFASKILLFSTFCRWPRSPTSKMDDPCLLFCCAIAGRASCIVWPCYFLIRLNLALHSSLKITSKNAPCWLMCAYLIGK